MIFTLRKRTPGQIEFGIIYGAIALIALFAGRFLPVLSFAPSCALRDLTGLPCPTCGATRSIFHLSHGHFGAAFLMNPLVDLCVLAALIYLGYALVTFLFDLPRPAVVLSSRERDRARVSAVIVLLINWIYLLFTR